MVGFFSLATPLTLLVLLGLAIYLFYLSQKYHSNLAGRTYSRGMNGEAGQTITATCPSGKAIKMFKANYICTTNNNNTEDTACDPFWSGTSQNVNFFNPSNTYDALSALSNQCNGKQSCSVTVPSNMNICAQSPAGSLNGLPCSGTIQLIGNYDCV